MLQLQNLTKRYDGHLVFEGLNHAFSPGCHALCEEDSTGKSTLLRLVAGVLAPDEGDILIDGHSIRRETARARAKVAYVPDTCLEFPELSGRELLQRLAQGRKARVTEAAWALATALGLDPHIDKPMEHMSTGTRRKVYLVAAAVGAPRVIVADGPTDGLDTQARIALAAQFRQWAQDRVLLVATHDAAFVAACGGQCLRIHDLLPKATN